MLRRALALFAALALAACAAADQRGAAEPAGATAMTNPDSQSADIPPEQDDFDAALYRELARAPGNHFVSPLSVESAFALVYAGARGETASEMARVFGYDADAAAAATAAHARDEALAASGVFTSANAVWVRRDFAIEPAYAEIVRDRLGAMIEALDFSNRRGAVRTINSWASDATRTRIPTLIGEDFITDATRLILTNAVYFKADWADQFRANDTREGDFHLASGETRRAPLMHQDTSARYVDGGPFQAAEFDYAGGDFALAVFLPRTADGLDAFESRLSGGHLDALLIRLAEADHALLRVTLPKVEMNASYDLEAPLQAIGLRTAFSDYADLSGISSREGLVVSRVIHKSFLKIDEQGTEAAAATAIGIEVTSAPIERPEPIAFTADRPFFIVLRHKPTRAILFLGRVVEPAAA